ncbi:hypothetical protein LTR99_002782 [Exophiala xenobiotica]|uniref:Ribosomal RNA-processing protein 1 n=1 Tax=Vermiconidia calcicola TaxID=1690605 RepID=A0AAV9QBN7_9PEZI|nr:hypothetical protein H2202_009153 [Exophiala xenobiotica]KAK5535406.1 hypothetical protein LTR23_008428 [Chaetothyriales sp. CCFEE 6169]KAK5538452.1 hypothetical protein LTR25_003994 [Vermiconidia calcicola]KAK5194280.1 hypothetical protein LTR92_005522 [Exophiala xenobiotica]KAK5264186.1 hypothetical protein LTR96_010457 [Exophiala xenobiotica]
MPDGSENEPIPSVKDLASSEPSIRRTCLKTIIAHIDERSPSSPLTSTQCLQLWRGLYVALYMHDSKNALSVQKLAAELAHTVQTMASKDDEVRNAGSQTYSWLETWSLAFWETICREWPSIDQWRMNKILLLVRFYLREVFNLSLQSVLDDDSEGKENSTNFITSQVHILEAWPLSPRERKVPDGLKLHVLDIWADELAGQVDAVQKGHSQTGETENESASAALTDVANIFMTPVEEVSKEALHKGVKMRAKEALKSYQDQFTS